MSMARTGSVLLATSVLLVAACGEDEPAAAPTTAAAVTTTVVARYEVASGPDDVVIQLTNEGGFVPAGTAFANTPVALITGDGLAISTGPVIAIFPGPLLPNVLQRTITPAAVQDLLAQADELGLLADVTYSSNEMIADAPTTVLVITVGGTTYRHEAYALGIDESEDPARAALEEFVVALADLPAAVGPAALGPEEPFRASSYLLQATEVDPTTLDTGEGEPRFVDWPPESNVQLQLATDCANVPAAAASYFEDADQLTYFVEVLGTSTEETTYQLSVVPQLPGRSC